ncbi:hypothetical protein [Roseisalinus antarcticus]|uniref:Uncharacterized protein n=1 Tax=Roseisalinus antarcticus TaxID=254357 RepID=A0A1Y5SHT3_9RHOB|nr:hypothetical protein [Roseisalinus antarcticus]SLN40450.1 hypothetical protein ROA7023_01579 [Roseisalinus antarcticus]
MRAVLLSSIFTLTFPAGMALAQDDSGWELRAGLTRASASVCSTGGACFGVTCAGAAGWTPAWFVEVEAISDAPPADPILAIRTEGTASERFALTSLSEAAGGDAVIKRYEGRIVSDDDALLSALQSGEGVVVDPGRDFALAEFSLRGSRWAVSAALDLCDEGGPDAAQAAPAE